MRSSAVMEKGLQLFLQCVFSSVLYYAYCFKCTYLFFFSHQLCIFTRHVELLFPFVLFYRQCTAVTSLFSQVEVGDIIRVNGSDFVPADAVILSSRYRSPSCCQTVGNFSLLSSFLLFALFSALPKDVMVRKYSETILSKWLKVLKIRIFKFCLVNFKSPVKAYVLWISL